MIRTKDIREKERDIKNLKSKIKSLENEIVESNRYLEQIDETDFEYIITEKTIEKKEKLAEQLLMIVKQDEYFVKLMKGEVEPVKPRCWEVKRPEVKLMEFGIEA